MARAAIVICITSVLIVLASFAGQPPNLEKALEAQRQLISQQPYDPQARNDFGNLLLVAGRAAEAEQAYRRAVELDPRNTAARFNLAILLQQSDRAEEAMIELQGLLEIDPYHGWGHYQLGVLFDQQRDRSKALEHYARAFAYDPELTFAENNPHIIDNRMSTEALLMSQRYRRPQASGVPRLYSNPDRIVDLMLGEPAAEDEGMEAEEGSETQPSNAAASSPGGSAARLPSGAPDSGGPESDLKTEPSRAEQDEEEDDPPRRVLTPASVEEGGSRNRASAVPSSGSSRSDSRESLRQAFEERFKAARERAQTLQPSTGGSSTGSANPPVNRSSTATGTTRRPRYIPGRSSTGRLELEIWLSPGVPAERHAAITGSASAS
ncbi:MAG: tetratricopeptide repeat protein [Thermoanaerobaculia bacterium]